MCPTGADEASNTLQAAQLRRIFAYWDGLRGDRTMPSREEVDPAALRDVLPHIVMIDVERAPLRFRYRLVGTYITTISNRDITGQYVDETTFPQQLDQVITPYRMVVEHRAPVGKYGQARWIANRPWVRLETLLLPLGSTGEEVEIILAGIAQCGRAVMVERGSGEPTLQGVHTFLNPRFVDPPQG